ncbi:MAG: hypothetical protein PHQ23_05290 [Candidatus Wallbacteria bacterium]|nr:hypothetical protein [Candidatus Wallbacteria bacterium]
MKTRKSIRLPEYDYAQNGAYFVTICAAEKGDVFGKIGENGMVVNEYGRIAVECWQALPGYYSNVFLDIFCLMPDHFHGILFIDNDRAPGGCDPCVCRSGDDAVGVDFKSTRNLGECKSCDNMTNDFKSTRNPGECNSCVGMANSESPDMRADLKSAPTRNLMHGLSQFIRSFKIFSTREINKIRNVTGVKIWQRNFFERVIRNDSELDRIREYIRGNPHHVHDLNVEQPWSDAG